MLKAHPVCMLLRRIWKLRSLPGWLPRFHNVSLPRWLVANLNRIVNTPANAATFLSGCRMAGSAA